MNYKPKENQIGGDHYCEFDAWYFADKFNLNRYEMPAIKYLLRYHKKNGVEDLRKAIDYIEKRDSVMYNGFINSAVFVLMLFKPRFLMKRFSESELIFLGTLHDTASDSIIAIITAKQYGRSISGIGTVDNIKSLIKELEK